MADYKDLIDYCKLENKKEVLLLIEQGVSIDHNEQGITPLHIASAIGAENVVDSLFSRGVSIDESTNMGWTPLMYAARKGHAKTVQQLIEKGADVDHRNKLGVNILSMAAASGNSEVFEIVLKTSDKSVHGGVVSPLHIAALQGQCSMLQFLLCTHPHLININDEHGITPLMLAVAGNQEEAVKIFLNKGADTTLRNSQNFSALDIAIINDHQNIISLLQDMSKEERDHCCKDTHYAKIGFDLVEQYGWSQICTPKLERSKWHMDSLTDSHTEVPLDSSFHLKMGTNSNTPQVTESTADFVSVLFSPIHVPSYNKYVFGESSKCNYHKSTKSSTQVLVPPLTPYIPPPEFSFNFFSAHGKKMHSLPNSQNFTFSSPEKQTKTNSSTIKPQNSGNCCEYYESIGGDSTIQRNTNEIQSGVRKETRVKVRKTGKIEKWIRNIFTLWQRNTRVKASSPNNHKNSLIQSENSARTPKGKISPLLPKVEGVCPNNVESAALHSSSTLKNLLVNLKLQAYIPLFLEHEVDMDSFMMLNQEDLQEIGITSPNSQSKLLKVIMTFKGEFT